MTFQFNNHSNLAGQHAFLGASKYHWLKYSDDRLREAYTNSKATEMGTRLHALAAELIELGVKLPKTEKTLNLYVNDAIGFRMQPEVVLYYSPFCFGTADAIRFKKDFLRIHDLKTGESPASMSQLMIYAAIFCLEYRVDPQKIKCELRIYQSDNIEICTPTPEEIQEVMDKIVHANNILMEMQEV